MRLWAIILSITLLVTSCNEFEQVLSTPSSEDEQSSTPAPIIEIDNTSGVYTLKIGRSLTISPLYTNAEGATFEWSIDDEIVSEEESLTYTATEVGEYIISLTVTTTSSTTAQMRIDVVELEVPTISLLNYQDGYTLEVGKERTFTPSVKSCSIECSYLWLLDGEIVSDSLSYTFCQDNEGEYTLRFETLNEDAGDCVEFTVTVTEEIIEELHLDFTQDSYTLESGQSLLLAAINPLEGEGYSYSWSINGEVVQQGEASTYTFSQEAEGDYTVSITINEELTKTITVSVYTTTTQRPITEASNYNFDKVYEFLAAPGQFVNNGYSATTMAEACDYAQGRLEAGNLISLGGFGGYVVVGFDHSVVNQTTENEDKSYDFVVVGNQFATSSEPAVVWVMQDTNGDGLHNDTWYELRGSESGKDETIQNYEATYYRPSEVKSDVLWEDNQGNTGSIAWIGYNPHDYYYPAWVSEDSYTLRGTCLEARNIDSSGSGSSWSNQNYDWGYADNYSSVDCVEGSTQHTLFDISDAWDGVNAVELEFIDFVKVQTAVNASSGLLGEISTEVTGIYDYNLYLIQNE